ncbi:predicted protein [Sclerotinia sclerotiorum 1980 UF-70]|uniref:Uncharacterized protein n=1 Tax=Sclerotinia sclerotiorum (strain ATCC 18683 / 1980 / Ss-1) TaxID=665079 RepID=A7F9W9_SCLS1|nr:predicted protein [Sclerotinia sclerotiorum 1980 UF-70]EDO00530.1 predicted protein [Sclerotinia sclerotiorum 1980 UF-70]
MDIENATQRNNEAELLIILKEVVDKILYRRLEVEVVLDIITDREMLECV